MHPARRGRGEQRGCGLGPAGEAAAELGGNLGYSVALVERDTVGGTVITSGAPTKTFREAAVYLSSFEKDKIYGIALSAPPEVMYPAVRARARQVSEQLRQATLEASPTGHASLAMIHNQATIEDVIRMAYNTPTYTYGYKLAATDALARLNPDILRAMRLPSRAHRI